MTDEKLVRRFLRKHRCLERPCLRVLTNKLNKKKKFSKWVPHLLTDEQKDSRVNFSRNFLRRFQAEQNDFLGRIITGDETWVYSWDPETKRQSAEWRDFDEPRPEKVRRKQGALKVMHMIFFDMNGVILRWPIPIGTTINAQYYKKVLARQTQTCHSKETTRAVGVRHLVSPRQCASPYGPGSDRRFDWLQVGTAGASSLFT